MKKTLQITLIVLLMSASFAYGQVDTDLDFRGMNFVQGSVYLQTADLGLLYGTHVLQEWVIGNCLFNDTIRRVQPKSTGPDGDLLTVCVLDSLIGCSVPGEGIDTWAEKMIMTSVFGIEKPCLYERFFDLYSSVDNSNPVHRVAIHLWIAGYPDDEYLLSSIGEKKLGDQFLGEIEKTLGDEFLWSPDHIELMGAIGFQSFLTIHNNYDELIGKGLDPELLTASMNRILNRVYDVEPFHEISEIFPDWNREETLAKK